MCLLFITVIVTAIIPVIFTLNDISFVSLSNSNELLVMEKLNKLS